MFQVVKISIIKVRMNKQKGLKSLKDRKRETLKLLKERDKKEAIEYN